MLVRRTIFGNPFHEGSQHGLREETKAGDGDAVRTPSAHDRGHGDRDNSDLQSAGTPVALPDKGTNSDEEVL